MRNFLLETGLLVHLIVQYLDFLFASTRVVLTKAAEASERPLLQIGRIDLIDRVVSELLKPLLLGKLSSLLDKPRHNRLLPVIDVSVFRDRWPWVEQALIDLSETVFTDDLEVSVDTLD